MHPSTIILQKRDIDSSPMTLTISATQAHLFFIHGVIVNMVIFESEPGSLNWEFPTSHVTRVRMCYSTKDLFYIEVL